MDTFFHFCKSLEMNQLSSLSGLSPVMRSKHLVIPIVILFHNFFLEKALELNNDIDIVYIYCCGADRSGNLSA